MAGSLTGRTALALMLAVGLSGCITSGGGRPIGDPFSGGGGSSRADAGPLRVEVDNRNFNQATVTARGPAMQRRLGRVRGNEQAEFTLQWNSAAQLYFEIEILGGDRCNTRMVQVNEGASIRVVIDSMSRMRGDGISRWCDVEPGRR